MNFIWEFLDLRMNQPQAYGPLSVSWFHYLSLLLTLLSFFFFFNIFKKSNDKTIKKTLLITGIVMIVFEIYKQVIFTYQASSYQWYAFPFQFCSTPMYLYIIYGLTKTKKLDSYLISFLGTFAAFAGLAVMLYPATVFIDTIGINIQTMVHHGLMIAIGFALLLTKTEISFKSVIRGMIVFASLCAVAYLLNTLYSLFINTAEFNMFFISPKYKTDIPILSMIQPNVPHIVFIIIYILGFTLMATLMTYIGYLLKKLAFKNKKQLVNVFAK